MPRWLFAAAVLTLTFAFSASPAKAGLFSHHGGCNDCAPSCCAPSCCAPAECAPSCCAPTGCCNTAPTCCAPTDCCNTAPSCCAPVGCAPSCCAPSGCGDVCGGGCDSGCCYDDCNGGCCLKRWGHKMMSLEKRKNACLKRTFLGWRHKGCNDGCYDCAPVEYYQPSCCAPACAAPCGCH